MKLLNIILSIGLIFIATSCSEDSETTKGVEILKGISEDPELTTLSQAIEKAGLRKSLAGTQYTFFAPTNQAFTDAGINVGSTDASTLLKVLQYHMIPTRLDATRLDVDYGKIAGTIVRDAVPGTYAYATNWIGNLTYAGVQTLNLSVNANIYYTQAIQVLDNNLGTLSLEGFYVNGSKVTSADAFEGGDGVVHKIDRVLLPPTGSISQTIAADAELSLFDKLIKKASASNTGTPALPSLAVGVLDVLPANALTATRAGSFTVLAPTDAAMIAAGHTSAAIDGYTVAQCTSIARQHVVSLRNYSSDLKNQLFRNNPAVTTVGLTPIATAAPLAALAAITYNNDGVNPIFFSTTGTPSSTIAKADIVTTNGVIHKINTVLQ